MNGKSATILPPVVNGDRQVLSNTGINRRTFSRIPTVLEMPNLVQVQIESFNWFLQEGLKELLEEISPISDHHRKMELYISDPRFEEPWNRLPTEELRRRAKADPRVAEIYCRDRDLNYAAPLFVSARLAGPYGYASKDHDADRVNFRTRHVLRCRMALQCAATLSCPSHSRPRLTPDDFVKRRQPLT